MDDQNEGLNERWGSPRPVPERGYAEEEPPVERRTAEIRSDIEQTRTNMTETIDAIQEKLRPGNIVSQATESVRSATVGRVKDMARSARDTFRGDTGGGYGSYRMVDRIRDNPIPAALVAASVAWIAFSGRRAPRRTSRAAYGPARHDERFIREAAVSEYEGRDSSRTAGYEASGVGPSTESTGGDAGQRVQQATSTARKGMLRAIRKNPLAAGVIAAAAGATLGLALPETHGENEVMGEARDTVVNRAQEAARDAAERVQSAARRVQDVAGEAARTVTGEE